MKTIMAIAAVAFAGALQLAAAQPPVQPVLASAAVIKHQFRVTTPFSGSAPGRTGKIERYGNLSSRPWTKIVGWHPGAPAWTFADGENQEPQLQVVSVNF